MKIAKAKPIFTAEDAENNRSEEANTKEVDLAQRRGGAENAINQTGSNVINFAIAAHQERCMNGFEECFSPRLCASAVKDFDVTTVK